MATSLLLINDVCRTKAATDYGESHELPCEHVIANPTQVVLSCNGADVNNESRTRSVALAQLRQKRLCWHVPASCRRCCALEPARMTCRLCHSSVACKTLPANSTYPLNRTILIRVVPSRGQSTDTPMIQVFAEKLGYSPHVGRC